MTTDRPVLRPPVQLCSACDFHWRTYGVRCLTHTPLAQRQARSRKVGTTR